MKNLDELVNLRFCSRFMRLLFTVLCNLSSNALHEKIGNGPIAIVYTSEFSSRVNHILFLKALVNRNPDYYTLYFFKRKFTAPKRLGSYRRILRYSSKNMYTQYLMKHPNLILFAPHQIFSEAILGIVEESSIKHRTVCLQHGYYNYSNHANEIYSKSTRTDYAIVFNKDIKTLNFFQNVNRIYDIGYYFVDPVPKELPTTNGISIFLTKVSERELLECLNFIFSKYGRSEFFNISLHPHQKLDEAKVKALIDDVNYIFNKKIAQGKINIFYETTAYYSFKNLSGKNFFLSRDYKITELKKIPFDIAIAKLSNTIRYISR